MAIIPVILLISYYLNISLPSVAYPLSGIYFFIICTNFLSKKFSQANFLKEMQRGFGAIFKTKIYANLHSILSKPLLLYCLVCIYPSVALVVQLIRLKNGYQGIDFAIFSQCVHQFSTNNILRTSLVDYTWQNFLTHHFSPYLFLVGYLNKLFLAPEILLLVLHSLTIAAILVIFFKISLLLTKDKLVSILLVALIILLPAPRYGLTWEVRDEIFAMPFFLAAYLFWFKKQHQKAIILLLLSTLFKETLFVAVIFFCLMSVGFTFLNREENPKKIRIAYLLCLVITLTGFILYTKILPGWIFWPTFATFSRISSMEQLFDAVTIKEKLYWLMTILIPICPLLIVMFLLKVENYGLIKVTNESKKFSNYFLQNIILLCLPAIPFVGAVLISNFDVMHYPYSYYSVVPAFLVSLAVFISACKIFESKSYLLKHPLLIGCLLACFFQPLVTHPIGMKEALNTASPIKRISKMIPETATVITGDYDASFLIKQNNLIRLFHANKNILKFDYIVQRKTGPSASSSVKLSRYLRSWSKLCYEDEIWIVRCALDRVKTS